MGEEETEGLSVGVTNFGVTVRQGDITLLELRSEWKYAPSILVGLAAMLECNGQMAAAEIITRAAMGISRLQWPQDELPTN